MAVFNAPWPHDGLMFEKALKAHVFRSKFDEVDLTKLDLDHLPEWISLLRDGERELRAIRHTLEAMLPEVRQCAVCGKGFVGRADRKYCGPACRQRASRASRAPRPAP